MPLADLNGKKVFIVTEDLDYATLLVGALQKRGAEVDITACDMSHLDSIKSEAKRGKADAVVILNPNIAVGENQDAVLNLVAQLKDQMTIIVADQWEAEHRRQSILSINQAGAKYVSLADDVTLQKVAAVVADAVAQHDKPKRNFI